MAPKNKSKDTTAGASASKLKPATSINVRHILCEKHSIKEKALEQLASGRKFDDVARDLSDDKARQGELLLVEVELPFVEVVLTNVLL
jgi:NIMA-interacting peptidyl-prolyl cis-trans isomerase 4